MPFNLFHKKKQPEQQVLAPSTPDQPEQQAAPAEQPQVLQEVAPTPSIEPEVEASVPAEEPAMEPEPEPAPAAQEQPQETPAAQPEPVPEQTQEAPAPTPEQAEPQPAHQPVEQKSAPAAPEPANKTYLKAMPLKDLADVETVKNEVRNGNIIILRITPLAGKSIEDVKTAVNDLFAFAESIQGDIARLGEERVVICPKTIRIWREKTPAPVSNNQPLPTAA
jgi:uncharacterized protein